MIFGGQERDCVTLHLMTMEKCVKDGKIPLPDVVSENDITTYLIAYGHTLRKAYLKSKQVGVT